MKRRLVTCMSSDLRKAIARILLEDLDPLGPLMTILKKVDVSDYHMLPLDVMSDLERDLADRLVLRGLLRKLPANGRFPDRYVVTSSGSHALGTFDHDTLHDEMRARRANKRRAKVSENAENPRPEWLSAQRAALEAMPFEKLLSIVRWNDPNGAWSDEELIEYETDKDMLVDVVMEWIAETGETPAEWFAGHTANHLGKPSYRGNPL